jgi:hypothetical protein
MASQPPVAGSTPSLTPDPARIVAVDVVKTVAITPTEARAISKEAYVYGFPLVDSYRIQYSYFADTKSPEFKGPWNKLVNTPRVYTPADTAIQTPNSDTPYSFIGMDLRAEPIVLTVPTIAKDRYYSIQLIDAYTFNFDYIGSRATGNEEGSCLIAGPNWKGETPKGVKKVIRSETDFVLALYRTQLFDPSDIDNVKKVQSGYKAQPLSAFLGTAAPPAAPSIDFVKPLTPQAEKTSLEFFNILNFVLQFCPTNRSETDLMARFAKIGVGAGQILDVSKLSPEMIAAISAGIGDAWGDLAGVLKQFDLGQVKSGDVFGTREYLKNNYLYRMAAAAAGIYGNSKQEAMYPVYGVDEAKQKLNGANRYTLRFAPGEFPPVNAFWSLTMYEMPASLLVANPINRYLLNSPMLPQFKLDADGGLTLIIQNESPGKDKESNWLPAPKGPFIMYMRLYWPKETAVDGTWTPPPLKRDSETGVKVTPETYIRAECDRQFGNIFKMAGGINRLFHFRQPTPLDKQNIVRMNRDTLYSMGVVDTSKGATITVPELPKDRYVSVYLVDNDHYCPLVIYTSGTHELPTDTKYLGVGVRIQVFNPKDTSEVALVNKLQDQFIIKANSADPLPEFKWDHESLQALTSQYEKDSLQYTSWKGMMGPRGKVDEKTRHIAAAAAWGLFPEWDATYLNYAGGGDDPKIGKTGTYKVPENEAFWSITVYGNDGYMKSDKNIVNSSNVRLNADGTFTVYFGSTETFGDVPNRLDVSEGWNFLMRIYRPGASVLNGSYKLPDVTPRT